MRKVKTYKGFIIAELNDQEQQEHSNFKLHAYLKDDWALGKGYRWPEWEADSMEEMIDFIDSY